MTTTKVEKGEGEQFSVTITDTIHNTIRDHNHSRYHTATIQRNATLLTREDMKITVLGWTDMGSHNAHLGLRRGLAREGQCAPRGLEKSVGMNVHQGAGVGGG